MNRMRNALLSIAIVWFAMPTLAADNVTTVPVRFDKGASSATLKGSFRGYDTVHYTLAARAGQTMTVSVAGSSNANFNVYAPGDAPGTSAALGSNADRKWTGRLPTSGTYTVQVYQMRASARRGEQVSYSITIAIR
ncbi:g-type lysozyme inhibitor [Lysobacter arvi]|uniref:G-type lysozyme inhibitor n=1 Tax=Lysobacter arvi TaxID=3038776 RepID=A0ABU1C9X4_9GAMM|nr:g-type lysozyme inhibitor [Lysobacter arvi]MDR0181920.1 g-type lysozyme inhibitor [Lysobacter arvi]